MEMSKRFTDLPRQLTPWRTRTESYAHEALQRIVDCMFADGVDSSKLRKYLNSVDRQYCFDDKQAERLATIYIHWVMRGYRAINDYLYEQEELTGRRGYHEHITERIEAELAPGAERFKKDVESDKAFQVCGYIKSKADVLLGQLAEFEQLRCAELFP